MARVPHIALLVALSLGASAARADVGSHTAPIIYGTDDRLDLYEETDATWRDLGTQAIVALVPVGSVSKSGPTYSLDPATLGEVLGVCPDQEFVDQPSAAYCSGTLIDDDLVLTAGHCVTPPYDADSSDASTTCSKIRFVFDYYQASATDLATIGAEDVYACRRVVTRHVDATLDYAIIALDRPVTGHVPADVAATDGAVGRGSSFTVVGFPSGLPMKFAAGEVSSSGPPGMRYFVGNPDTFGGNSGSGVFDDGHSLIGVLVRGGEDYVQRAAMGCYQVNVADPIDTGGEEMTYVHRATNALCAAGYPSERVCGVQPRCGDGFCTSGESSACASDCTGDVCGDGVCGATETNTLCDFDCAIPTVMPPPPVTKKHYGACTVHGDASDRDAGGDERSAWTSAFVLVVALALLRNLRSGRGRVPLRDVG